MKHKFLNKNLLILGVLLISSWGVASAQTITVSGQVTSSTDKQPISGATISVPHTSKGTVSDASGRFRLQGVSSSDSLVFSFIGFESKEVAVNGRTRINMSLESNVSELNQVIVIGYGATKKRDLTGAVSHVNVEKLQNENPISVQDALRANVPGLDVGFSAGAEPGGSLQIRGQNSLTAGTSPLIV